MTRNIMRIDNQTTITHALDSLKDSAWIVVGLAV